MLKRTGHALLLTGLAAAIGLAAPAAAQEDVLAKVGDVEITEAEVGFAAADFANELAQVPEAQRRGILLNVLVDMELLAQAAEEDGLASTPEFEERMSFLRRRALRNAYVEQELVNGLSDEEVRAEYDKQAEGYEAQEELRARHILVESKEEADDIIKQLDDDASFAELAAEHSTDGTAQNGGDLGYFSRGQMVDPFEEAVFALEPGSYTEEPVETQFGWHVILLEDKRMSSPPPFEDVADQLRAVVLREKFEETMASLREKFPVEILDPSLAPQEPADASPEGEADPAAGEPAAQ